ncbi:zinc finger and SCAN domain-containing protein 10 [Nephila pilipes]|uniref:Zinc finger and SCAN domain-containing protein 10 n=1 Tax=Nephila pilipes TaxID=299642 RepID=A0A8X6N680_NEPPI|nr:zinc finger and SCAN domain-containing protein 10 [Nephila pilipes]
MRMTLLENLTKEGSTNIRYNESLQFYIIPRKRLKLKVILKANDMTEDVNGGCSILNNNPHLDEPLSTTTNVNPSVSQLDGTLYLNPNMTVEGSCLYTAADFAGSFPEGTVLQILSDSTLLAVPIKEAPSNNINNNTVIFKDSSFPADLNATQVSNLMVENNDQNQSPDSEVPMYSEGNISDIDLSFLNETEESVPAPLAKNLNNSMTKELQETIPIVSSQSLEINQNSNSSNDKDNQELQPDHPKESDGSADSVVMIDVSKPIQLSQNSLIMVNGQKCVLQHDLQTGQVIAYPVKEQDKPRRKRGRPRKPSLDLTLKDTAISSEPSPAEIEVVSDEGKEGLLEIVNDDGSLVRRSSRKRKRAKVLRDYETGNLKQELGSDVDETETLEIDPEIHSRKRKSKGPGRPRKCPIVTVDASAGSQINGGKRQRGRPRKQAPENEPTQAFLVQTADGQTLMMQVPLSSIPPGVSLQEVAQNIANRLNIGLSQASPSPVDVATILQSNQKSCSDNSVENAAELAVQDHSIGSTTNFSSVDQFQSTENVEDSVGNSSQSITTNVNNVIVDSMGDSEIREVILGNEENSKASDDQPDNLLSDNILQTPAQFSDLEIPQSPEENFSLNIPVSNSSSNNMTSTISNLPENLSDTNPQSKTDEQDLVVNFNQFQIPKDFLISGDFIKGKMNLNQLLDNVVNNTSLSQLPDTCTEQIDTPDGKSIATSDSEVQFILNESNNLKDFETDFVSQSTKSGETTEERQYISNMDESEKLPKNFDFLNCDISNSNLDNNEDKESPETHSIISSIVHDHNLLIHPSVTERNEVVESSFVKSNISIGKKTFQRILPLDKSSIKISPNETTVLSVPATTVVPVSSNQQLQLSDKMLPIILSPQELPGSQKCKVCQRPYFSEEEIIKHFKAEHPKCICSHCNYMAEHAYVIKRHSIRHIENGIVCDMCGKHYKDHYILKMHIKMVHMPAEVVFTCEICQKKFTRKAHLKRHLRIHEPHRPYKCSFCSYRGCEKSDITKHLLIHEAPKHKCQICNKAFRHLKNKELHVKRHFKQRDYKCGICDFYGYTFTDIRRHIERRHTDSKSTTCSECGLVFESKEELDKHNTSGQCPSAISESNLIMKEKSAAGSEAKKDISMLEMPLDILGGNTQESNSGENPDEQMSTLQSGQLILPSSQSNQIIINGLEGTDLFGPENLTLLPVEGDSNKMIALVSTDGKNFALPLKDLSTSTNFLTSDKNSNVEPYFCLNLKQDPQLKK